MIWGFSLHGWEDVMRFSLAIVGVFGLIVGLSTWFVVKLQRAEIAESKIESDKYKIDTSKEISEAKARQTEAELKLAELRKLSGPKYQLGCVPKGAGGKTEGSRCDLVSARFV